MRSRSTSFIVALTSCACLCAGARGAEPPRIDRFAPPGTFLVFSVPDWARAVEHARGTELGRLWERQEVQDFLAGVREDLDERLADALGEGIGGLDELAWPAGHAGLALSFRKQEGVDGGEAWATGFTLCADFGEEAERVREVIDDLLREGEESGRLRVSEEEEEGGTLILTVERIAAEDGEEDTDEAKLLPLIPANLQGDLEWLQIAMVDQTLVVSSVPETVWRALDTAEGEVLGNAPADLAAYREAAGAQPERSDAYIVAFADETTRERIERDLAAPFLPFLADLTTGDLLRMLGLSEVTSGVADLRFGVEGGLAEVAYAVGMAEKKGLVSLADITDGPFEPPHFAGVEAAQANRFMFDFSGLFEVARGIVGNMDEQLRAQAEAGLAFIQPLLEPLLRNVGPEIWTIETIERPLSEESVQRLVALPVRDELVVSNSIVGLMGQMQGAMTASEFEGGTIWTDAEGQIAIGLGLGHLFSGTPERVRAAMRRAANPDGPRLATEGAFRAAARRLSGEAVWYGYTSMRPTLELAWWRMENANRLAYERIEAIEFPEELKRRWLDQMSREPPEWVRDLPAVEVILEHVGDMSWELVSTPEGFGGRMHLLPARK